MTDGYNGIFNMHTNLGACRTHEGGLVTNKSAQELTRQGIEPSLHSLDFNFDALSLTTELRSPIILLLDYTFRSFSKAGYFASRFKLW